MPSEASAKEGWLDALIGHERVSLDVVDRESEAVLKAGMAMHLSKLAWQTLLAPLARQAGLPTSALLESPPIIFTGISKIGVLTATRLLGAIT
jgi:hypothetical protein